VVTGQKEKERTMINLDNNPSGQSPEPPTGQIDNDLLHDPVGPGRTTKPGEGVKIRGQIKTSRGLSKKGKQIIMIGGAGVAGLIIVGVMSAGHHGGASSSSVSVQIAGAKSAPTPPKRVKPVTPTSPTASTLSARGTQSPSSSLSTSTPAPTEPQKKPALTPAQKYARWLVKQHYKELEGQHLAAQSALVATGNWQAARSPMSMPVSATAAPGYPQVSPMAPNGYPMAPQNQGATGAAANEAFLAAQRHKKERDEGYLDSRLHKPASPTELFAGSVVPAVLVTGINSQLPGEITAEVRQNVYNSLDPQQVLIPQGSKVIGVYDSDVQYGQDRVLVAWSRIIYPNGETVDLRGMSGVDGLGEAGFSQITDNHYLRIFGSALLISLLGAGAQLAQPQQSSALVNPNAGQTATGAIAQEMDSVGANMLNKNLNIAPTLKIRPGYLFNILVNKTMILPVYHP
jgi:type IV secretion system protein VirB10